MDALRDVRLGIDAVPLLAPLTGVGRYTWHLVDELQKLLVRRPRLFYGTGWSEEMRSSAPFGARGVNAVIKKTLPRPEMITHWIKQLRFAQGTRRIDLYHEPAYLAFPFWGPTVITVHDLSWIRHPETHPAWRVREMNRLLPSSIERSAHIVVDSEFVRQEVMSYYGISPQRVSTALLGVSPWFRPLDAGQCAPVLHAQGLQYRRYLLAVGTLEPRKNLATAIAAYARLPKRLRQRYPLVLAGMQGWRLDSFPDLLRPVVESGEVVLAGYVAQDELPALYSGARLLVYPSLYEGFGLPPLEAMACGTPVIVSRRASLPEVVGDAGMLVEPQDDIALAQGMQRLIEDEALHTALSLAGRTRARTFTWRRFAEDVLAVYRKVLA